MLKKYAGYITKRYKHYKIFKILCFCFKLLQLKENTENMSNSTWMKNTCIFNKFSYVASNKSYIILIV